MEQSADQQVVEEQQGVMPLSPKKSRIRLSHIVLAVAFLLTFAAIGTGVVLRNSDTTPEQKTSTVPPVSVPYSLVYGYWTANAAEIASYDLASHTSSVIASLPKNIKFVSVLPDGKLVFISGLDTTTRFGKEMSQYDPVTKEITILFSAEEGFGINDYAISPSGQYIATWEVRPLDGYEALYGGRSHVYGYNSENGKRRLINEQMINPAQVPVAVTDEGVVYMDAFLPNIGVGWAFGMSRIGIDGTGFEKISSMTNGTYSSQPFLSRDGQKLYFLGYDGSKGDGDEYVNGYRKGLTNSNTIEMLDLTTLERTVLLQSENVLYDDLSETSDNRLTYVSISNDEAKSGRFSFTPVNGNSTKLEVAPESKMLDEFAAGTLLTANYDEASGTVGDIGKRTTKSLQQLGLVRSQVRYPLSAISKPIQLVGVVASGTLSTNNPPSGQEGTGGEGNRLQLATIYFEPELKEEREKRQSEPPPLPPIPEIPPLPPQGPPAQELPSCFDYATQKCNEVFPPSERTTNSQDGGHPYNKCVNSYMNSAFYPCQDSPLYLYGPKGMNVWVGVGTAIYSPNASYDPASGWNARLLGDGTFVIGANLFSSLEFDYAPASTPPRPTYGVIVERENIDSAVGSYAQKLGLNERESKDVVQKVKSVNSPYIFVSHYDQETSKRILPLVFDPVPDNYYNVVFYLQGLDSRPQYSLQAPIIEPLGSRNGFTAVEVSYIEK